MGRSRTKATGRTRKQSTHLAQHRAPAHARARLDHRAPPHARRLHDGRGLDHDAGAEHDAVVVAVAVGARRQQPHAGLLAHDAGLADGDGAVAGVEPGARVDGGVGADGDGPGAGQRGGVGDGAGAGEAGGRFGEGGLGAWAGGHGGLVGVG
jgi:hypothetical protein